MALVIDERVAGGRPQKLSTPTLKPLARAAGQLAVRVRSIQDDERLPRSHRVPSWARA